MQKLLTQTTEFTIIQKRVSFFGEIERMRSVDRLRWYCHVHTMWHRRDLIIDFLGNEFYYAIAVSDYMKPFRHKYSERTIHKLLKQATSIKQ